MAVGGRLTDDDDGERMVARAGGVGDGSIGNVRNDTMGAVFALSHASDMKKFRRCFSAWARRPTDLNFVPFC